MAAVIGASLVGLKSLTATSGPDFLKTETCFAALAEISCVASMSAIRPSTGIPTATAQETSGGPLGTHGDHPMIVLCPASYKNPSL